jgi:hypothetical protein
MDRQRRIMRVSRSGASPGRILFPVTVVGVTVVGLILVTLSPLALRFLAALHGFHWEQLSNVGQTYGAVSALLVVLGLSGVAVTVFLQVRESRHARIEAIRTRHYDLMRLAMGDKIYTGASRALSSSRTFNERRLAIFINLEIQFWLMLWEFNEMSESELRLYIVDLLGTRAGYRHWEVHGRDRSMNVSNRRQRRFVQIINEEFQQFMKARNTLSGVSSSRAKAKRSLAMPISLGFGLLTVVLARVAVRRVRRRLK